MKTKVCHLVIWYLALITQHILILHGKSNTPYFFQTFLLQVWNSDEIVAINIGWSSNSSIRALESHGTFVRIGWFLTKPTTYIFLFPYSQIYFPDSANQINPFLGWVKRCFSHNLLASRYQSISFSRRQTWIS